MGVAVVIDGVLLRAAFKANVADADQRAAILEVAVGAVAGGVAQLMAGDGGIDEIIALADAADGTGFKEGMALVGRAHRQFLPGRDAVGLAAQRAHVGLQFKVIGAIHDALAIAKARERAVAGRDAEVEVDAAILVHEQAGIVGEDIPIA